MYDTILRQGTICDGTGTPAFIGDIAIKDKFIADIQPRIAATADHEVDASELVVSPGFINMLSWSCDSLIEDGRSMSELKQGVTLQIMGEGTSMGPWNEAMKETERREQGDIKYDITWTSLREYLEVLTAKGISCNVGSFVGATTVRRYVLGDEARQPNKAELEGMQQLVRDAMKDGALGVASALIYAPAYYAD